MFAHKLPIKFVHMLENSATTENIMEQYSAEGRDKNFSIVVIYEKCIVILEIGANEEFIIVQEIKLEKEGVLTGIEKILGYGKGILYMKDFSHRLILLKHSPSSRNTK